MNAPLIELKGITRAFTTGETEVTILKGIDLTINQGEMVAIIGASGSGKSTLMNIMGCLDHPSAGIYRFHGEDIGNYNSEQLAKLRREHFGFIFQRYHLLNTLNARGNVEVPAIYSGVPAEIRQKRAEALLSSLGLSERINYFPTQLSGGQQQRVSIARALMNGGEVILADEPTGALDSESGKAMLEILQNLNDEGQTIIIVTHDINVANHAGRIIELKDGMVIQDRVNTEKVKKEKSVKAQVPTTKKTSPARSNTVLIADRLINAFKMALISMSMQQMRTFLTMLGIIIGIASVVLVIALGKGTTDKILENINAMGTSTLTVYSGTSFGDQRSGRVRTLKPSDAEVLKQQEFIQSVTPVVSQAVMVRYLNIAVNANVSGVGMQFFDVQGYEIINGISFTEESESELRLEAVIDDGAVTELFPNGEDPIGAVIMLNRLPVRIIGVATSKVQGMGGRSSLNVWIPYSSAMKRMLGQNYLSNITIRVKDNVDLKLAEQSITTIIQQLHGKKDFFIFNADTIRETIEETTFIMKLLITSIAMISLIVGGIGVMNIMLVSVAERTREIGMRMAVGARKSDIAQQFLIEAILVCLIGGVIGIALALGIGALVNYFNEDFALSFSSSSIVLAFIASSLIGIIFGYFPAKRAAELAPIEALERS